MSQNKTINASQVVDVVDVSKATDRAVSVDRANNVNVLYNLSAQEIEALGKVIGLKGVFDSLGNVRDNAASAIKYDDTNTGFNVVNVQDAIEHLVGKFGGAGGGTTGPTTGGSNLVHIVDTTTLNNSPGATLNDKINRIYNTAASRTPAAGDLVLVSYDPTSYLNEHAGIWQFSGATWNQIADFSSLGGEPRIEAFDPGRDYKVGDKFLQTATDTGDSTELQIWETLTDVPANAWDWNDVEGGTSANNYWRMLGKLEAPKSPDDEQLRRYTWTPDQGMDWVDARGDVRVVPDQAARLALRYPEDIKTGTLIVQQDTGWTYVFGDSSIIPQPPAVTLKYQSRQGQPPSATNPINPIDFVFTGLPATAETTFVNHSVLLDTNTKKTSRAVFRFTLQQGDDITLARDRILAALPTSRNLQIIGTDTVRDTLPAHLFVMDAYIEAFSPPDPTAPISDANFRVFSDHITLKSFADIQDLERRGEVRDGMTVGVPDEEKVYIYLHGSWQELFASNDSPHQLRSLVYDPEQPSHDRLEWVDARPSLTAVATQTDLSDRAILPRSHLALGKLVFVRDEANIYQLVADPDQGGMTDTLADWQPLISGVTYVGREINLPDPTTETLVDGQQFIIRMDFGGDDLYRLVTWDQNIPAPAVSAINVVVTPGTANTDPVTIQIDDGGQSSTVIRHLDYDIDVSGTQYTGRVGIPAQSDAATIATLLQQELNNLGFTDVAVTVATDTVTLTPSNAATVVVTSADVPVPPQGGWHFLNREIWTKSTRGDADQQSGMKEGDLQITLERDHKELKIYNGGSWQIIHSDDEIASQIAALSLFEGTAKELGGTAVGAIELDHLPNLWTMEAFGDFSKVSHYWVYVGAPGFEVKSPAEEKQDAIAAGDSWGDIRVTTIPAQLPAGAGNAVQMKFEVLDAAGQPGGRVEVDKTLTLRFQVSRAGKDEFHEMRFNLVINAAPGVKVPMDAAAVANMVADTWQKYTPMAVQGQPAPVMGHVIGMTVSNPSNTDDTITFQPDPDTEFSIFHSIDGGTPGIGEDLAGAVLNPGDWIQVSRNTANAVGNQLHYVTVGGNLLTKDRADGLYSLQQWQAGGYESGSLVVHDGDVYRASRDVTGQDGDPKGTPVLINLVPTTDGGNLDGTGLNGLPQPPVPHDGDYEIAAGDSMHPLNGPFGGQNYQTGYVYIYSSAPEVAGTGTTEEGYPFDQGWILLGGGGAVPANPTQTHVRPTNIPWDKVDISGGLKVAQTDADLPSTAPAGQVWIVVQSAQAGGQGLFAYDMGTQQWEELGGGGDPIDITGGAIIYPNAYYMDGEPPLDLTDASVPQPHITGDTLLARNQGGYPLVVAVSKDGTTWSRFHPHRLSFDRDGAGKVAHPDYPMQFNIGITGNEAHITHVGSRNLDWVPMASSTVVLPGQKLSAAIFGWAWQKSSESDSHTLGTHPLYVGWDQAGIAPDLVSNKFMQLICHIKYGNAWKDMYEDRLQYWGVNIAFKNNAGSTLRNYTYRHEFRDAYNLDHRSYTGTILMPADWAAGATQATMTGYTKWNHSGGWETVDFRAELMVPAKVK